MQNGEFKKLIRFKDNTFCWNYGKDLFSDIVTPANAIAFGAWHLKIDKNELEKAMLLLGSSKVRHTVALFSHLNHFLYIDNINVEEAKDEQNREVHGDCKELE